MQVSKLKELDFNGLSEKHIKSQPSGTKCGSVNSSYPPKIVVYITFLFISKFHPSQNYEISDTAFVIHNI